LNVLRHERQERSSSETGSALGRQLRVALEVIAILAARIADGDEEIAQWVTTEADRQARTRLAQEAGR